MVPSKVPFLSFERTTKVICMPGNRASSVPSFVSPIRYAGHILYWPPAFFGACSNQLPASLTYFTRQASMHSNRRPEFKIARRDYGRDSALGQVRQHPRGDQDHDHRAASILATQILLCTQHRVLATHHGSSPCSPTRGAQRRARPSATPACPAPPWRCVAPSPSSLRPTNDLEPMWLRNFCSHLTLTSFDLL